MHHVGDEHRLIKLGDFAWKFAEGTRYIAMVLPGGVHRNGIRCVIPVKQYEGGGREWTWDGNEYAPTLTPSVDHVGHWHGYVTAGALVEA